MPNSLFEDFTNKYSLSKTLRFELRPVGKTLENMRAQFEYDEELCTFMKDQHIEDAYQALKPLIDDLHEEFIEMALLSDTAKRIPFEEYAVKRYELVSFIKSSDRNNSDDDKQKSVLEKELDDISNNLRTSLEKVFTDAGEQWKEKYPKAAGFDWKKGTNVAKGASVLESKDLLKLVGEKHSDDERIQKHLNVFKGFFTYFQGFNQNRENYYVVKDEKATAVASRIVHENLPKFAENIIQFEEKKNEYLEAHTKLITAGKAVVSKDGRTIESISEAKFSRDYFKKCLSQKEIEEYNASIGDCNFIINLYNQQTKNKLKQFKKLYKQIGCGKRGALFFKLDFEKKEDAKQKSDEKGAPFYSVEEILKLAESAGETFFLSGLDESEGVKDTPGFCNTFLRNREDYNGFYWSKVALNTISSKYFTDWSDLKDRLKEAKIFKSGGKNDDEDVKIPEGIHLPDLFEVLDKTAKWKEVLFKKGVTENEKTGERNKGIIESAQMPHEALLGMIADDIEGEGNAFLQKAKGVTEHTKQYFATSDSDPDKEKYRKEWKEVIKAWMDHALAVNRMLKYFRVRESKIKGEPIDSEMAQALDILIPSKGEGNIDWFGWYDALRNFLTQEPQDKAKENKLKLNFEKPNLLGGFVESKTEKSNAGTQYGAYVLRKKEGDKYMYFLGISKNNHLFSFFDDGVENRPSEYERMNYYQVKTTSIYGTSYDGDFAIDKSELSDGEIVKKLKIALQSYSRRVPAVKDLISKQYSSLNEIQKDIRALNGEKTFVYKAISTDELANAVEDVNKPFYLFQIRVNPRVPQTKLFEMLLSGEQSVIDLGKGEIFYRKQAIQDKRVKSGYEHKKYENGESYIIEKKRFTEEKFQLHLSIILNYKKSPQSEARFAIPFVNKYVNEELPERSNLHFLGIDRGEKHLAYYSLINSNSEIISQGSLNLPFTDKEGNFRTVKAKKRTLDKDGKEHEEEVDCKDYNALLEARGGNRDYARKNWQTIGTIKELKQGYLSQVVHEIAKLAVFEAKGPTFIVLENLNAGFMRGRQKIEKAIYQQFEVALAKKLGFLVDKSKDGKSGEVGSVTKAYQLTPTVKNFEDIKNRGQAGIMLFTRPDYTSKTDPVTGWRRHRQVRIGSGSADKIRENILNAFSKIGFDGQDYFFTYTDPTTNKQWTIWSGKNGVAHDRYYRIRNEHGIWEAKRQPIMDMLNGLFASFDKQRSIRDQIEEGVELKKINAHSTWESVRFVINLIMEMRNSNGGNDRDADFILSPVRDEKGNHFDSRVYWDQERWEGGVMRSQPAKLPSSGDASGAYNIARKGAIMNEHIKQGWRPYIRDEEWDAWLVGRDVWERWVRDNEQLLRRKS